MIGPDCGVSMAYTQTFKSAADAKNETDSLIQAVGAGVRIDSSSTLGDNTEIKATFSCRAYREAGGSCLLHSLDMSGISVPRIMRPSCHPQPQFA